MDLYLLMHSLLGSDSGFFSVKSISKSMKSEDDGGNLTFTLPRRGAIYNLLENHKKRPQSGLQIIDIKTTFIFLFQSVTIILCQI